MRLADLLRNGTGGTETNQKNLFGDVVLDTDMECDAIIFEELKKSGSVAFALSEEKPELIVLNRFHIFSIQKNKQTEHSLIV